MLYLITSPHSYMAGIYYVTVDSMAKESKLSPSKVKKVLGMLAEKNLAHYDGEAEVVWVVNMLAYQLARGAKVAKGIATHLESLPETQLKNAFLTRYAEMSIPYDTLSDTLSDRVCDTPPIGGSYLPSPSPSPSPVPDRPLQKASELRLKFVHDSIQYLNSTTGRDFKSGSKTNVSLLHRLWANGVRFEQVRAVVDAKAAQWLDGDMAKYLRPETLFGSKFKSYLDNDVGTGAPIRALNPNNLTADDLNRMAEGMQ